MGRYTVRSEAGAFVREELDVDLPDPSALQAWALIRLAETLRDPALSFWNTPTLNMLVRDECGCIVLALSVSGRGRSDDESWIG